MTDPPESHALPDARRGSRRTVVTWLLGGSVAVIAAVLVSGWLGDSPSGQPGRSPDGSTADVGVAIGRVPAEGPEGPVLAVSFWTFSPETYRDGDAAVTDGAVYTLMGEGDSRVAVRTGADGTTTWSTPAADATAITADDANLWWVQGDAVQVVDPATGAAVSEVPLPAGREARRAVAFEGDLWLTATADGSEKGAELLHLRADGSWGRSTAPQVIDDLVPGEGVLWAEGGGSFSTTILRVDPTDGSMVPVVLDAPIHKLTAGGGRLWVESFGGVVEVNAETLEQHWWEGIGHHLDARSETPDLAWYENKLYLLDGETLSVWDPATDSTQTLVGAVPHAISLEQSTSGLWLIATREIDGPGWSVQQYLG